MLTSLIREAPGAVDLGMAEMARLQFGRLTEAWKGEASDFTPLPAQQLDSLV
jgi:hypothetical protein